MNPINHSYKRYAQLREEGKFDGATEELSTLYKHLRNQAAAAIFKVLKENSKELSAEAAETAILRMADFRSGSGFATWAYRIAVNIARDEQRKRQLHNEVPLIEEAHVIEPPPENEESVMQRMKERLNPADYKLFTLLIEERLQMQVIAEILGVSRKTLWLRIRALKKKLGWGPKG